VQNELVLLEWISCDEIVQNHGSSAEAGGHPVRVAEPPKLPKIIAEK